jgi:hypothetical protein
MLYLHILLMEQSTRNLYPIEEEITPLDHWILAAGGSTSHLERLPSRLQESKKHRPMGVREELEQLVYENSYLRAELAWNQEARRALMDLQEKSFQATTILREALVEANHRLKQCERHFLELWGARPEQNSDGMRI